MVKNKEYNEAVNQERHELLVDINSMMDKPMTVLAFIWLVLITLDLIVGLSRWLLFIYYIIWIIFILDFVIGYIIAPDKIRYMKTNWITSLSVILPAFGILRFFFAVRLLGLASFIRSINLLKILTSIRRGVKELESTLKNHGLGYILIITVILIFIGAAGMTYFESPDAVKQAGYPKATGLVSYWDALWWTAMIMTTIGSQYWPVTVEGRILAFLLGLYAFTFFGYTAATIASYFIKPK